jgi:hypothetical protein
VGMSEVDGALGKTGRDDGENGGGKFVVRGI